MSSIISPGELAVGQRVTVYHFKETESSFGPCPNHHHSALCGSVLEVKAVNLPYVLVKDVSTGFAACVAKLDTRDVDLMELSDEYVEAYIGKNKYANTK